MTEMEAYVRIGAPDGSGFALLLAGLLIGLLIPLVWYAVLRRLARRDV